MDERCVKHGTILIDVFITTGRREKIDNQDGDGIDYIRQSAHRDVDGPAKMRSMVTPLSLFLSLSISSLFLTLSISSFFLID